MLSRIALGRCCCDAEPEVNQCPCQSGTLTPAHDLTFSGITNLPYNGTFAWTLEANRTYLSGGFDIEDGFCRISQVVQDFSRKFSSSLTFTRLTTFVLSDGTQQIEYAIPSGIKVIARMVASDLWQLFGQPQQTTQTLCFFYKVVNSNANGSINCTDTISGFTFGGQFTTEGLGIFTGEPVFDASAGSVTYS